MRQIGERPWMADVRLAYYALGERGEVFLSLRYIAAGITLALTMAAWATGRADARQLVLSVPLADLEMRAATKRARAELNGFFERLSNPGPDEREFMIAYDAIPGKDEELVWVDELRRSGDSVTGTVTGESQRADVSAGDTVVIQSARIIDWRYRKGRVMQGGYTTRVLVARMPRDESYFLREYLGW